MFRRKVLLLVLIAVLISSTAYATAETEPISPAAGQANSSFTPYYFEPSYVQPEHVLKLYPDPDAEFQTPGLKERKWVSTHREMMDFLKELNNSASHMHLQTIGYSAEGRELPLAIFTSSNSLHSDDFKSKPTVWLQGQIHGNEPAGGESLLVIAHQLAVGELGEELLQDINVIVVPRVNPDGSYYFQRQTALRQDANRDHVKLDLPEIQAIHIAYNQYTPEVVVDAHEYGVRNSAFAQIGEEGGLQYYDILLLSGKNLNIPEDVRINADQWFVNPTFDYLRENGFSAREYFTTSYTDNNINIFEGGAEARIGRNAYGLQPSFSFLVESRGIGIGKENFVRRVAAQVATHTSLLRLAADRAEEVKTTIDAARKEIIRKGEEMENLVVNSERQEISGQQVQVVDIATGEVKEVPVTYYSSTLEQPTLVRKLPTAYLLPPAYHHIAEKLEIQGAQVNKLKEGQELLVESYKITGKEVESNYYEGHLLNNVQTEVVEKKVFFPKGSYVVSTAQPTGGLIGLALEPESIDSYVTFNFIPVNEGDEVPVYRYMQEFNLEVE